MSSRIEIVTVDATNVAQHGFFCYKSKPTSEGYRRKLNWLEQRFAEGLRIKILVENGRSVGFIEYLPGEWAWRAVHAANYVLIHCLWVVGRAKGKGYGSHLLSGCLEAAREAQAAGVAMVTSRRVWLAGPELLLKHGFEPVDEAPPAFQLLVKKFREAPSPTLPRDWDERARRFGTGLTIICSDQCPYIHEAVNSIWETGREAGIETRVVELKSAQEVQELAPSAYGTFGIVYDGALVSYYNLPRDKLLSRLTLRSE